MGGNLFSDWLQKIKFIFSCRTFPKLKKRRMKDLTKRLKWRVRSDFEVRFKDLKSTSGHIFNGKKKGVILTKEAKLSWENCVRNSEEEQVTDWARISSLAFLFEIERKVTPKSNESQCKNFLLPQKMCSSKCISKPYLRFRHAKRKRKLITLWRTFEVNYCAN